MKSPYLSQANEFDVLLDNLCRAISKDFSQDAARKLVFDKNTAFKVRFGGPYTDSLRHIRLILEIYDKFLDIKHINVVLENINEVIELINSALLDGYIDACKFGVDNLRHVWETNKEEINDKLSLLSYEEKQRLEEALHCYFEGCYYSAVAMSVSALEFRLLRLMKTEKPEKDFSKYMLGHLIDEYLKTAAEYNAVIPEKYEKILKPCNVYRIFSVHARTESVNKGDATAILTFVFKFLLDKNLKK